jgi:hypothetical protein
MFAAAPGIWHAPIIEVIASATGAATPERATGVAMTASP